MIKLTCWVVLIIFFQVENVYCEKPNFIIVYADDFGYGDLQSYGHPTQEKGPIDVLADEGMRFTQWYAPDSLCTPSRAALLTGRLPIRIGMVGGDRVLWQTESGGLPKNETTIAEALKENGYRTGMVGKWHLGINEFSAGDGHHLPHHHGFDFVGALLPFTFHWLCDPNKFSDDNMSSKCFLYCNATMKEQPINPEMLTQRIAADAVQFVKDNHDNPFFLYMGMPQTHTAMICSTKFCNKSRRGIYGDNVNEMSWAVGEVVNVVKQLGIEENTLVMFISDHGPQLEECFHGGSPGPLKGGKASSWEGGIRVPSIAWWPGKIPPGSVNHHVLSTMDVFPTLLALAGENNVGKQGTFLDGIRVDQLFAENHENVKPPHKILFHYCSKQLFAVRLGRYKIHYYTQNVEAHNYSSNCVDGQPMGDMIANMDCSRATKQSPPIMFDLETDPGERFQLEASLHEDVLTEAQTLIDEHRKTLTPVPQQLGNWNDDLQPCCNPPHCKCNEYDDSKFQQQVYKNEL